MAETRTRQFDALVAPHLPVLYRVAWRLLRNSPDAHDLVQDTCIAACENLSDLQAAEHPDRWLLQVLRNRFINVARRRRRAPFVALDDFPEVAQFSSGDPGPEELLHQDDRERTLERAFLQLEDTQRTLLALRAEGYGIAEMEAITGIPREALHARLYRARCSFARFLELQQGTVSGATPRPRSAS